MERPKTRSAVQSWYVLTAYDTPPTSQLSVSNRTAVCHHAFPPIYRLHEMLHHIPFPVLPVAPSWYPGHMTQFARALPGLLRRTDIVLELRDARLPLTSINRNFESKHLIVRLFSRVGLP